MPFKSIRRRQTSTQVLEVQLTNRNKMSNLDKVSDAEAYAIQLANMAPAENKNMPAVQFQLGEAMINQKKIRQVVKDIGQLKDILTEMQIYVQRHHVKINKDLVEKTELQIAVESLQTKLETRFDMNQLQQMDRIKMMIEGFVTEKQLDGRLVEKLHKREFEKQFERLDNSYAALEAKVVNTIPALSYEFKVGLETKASQRELEQMREEKASLVLVEALVKRLNKIEEAQLKGNFVAPQAQASSGKKPGSKQGKTGDGELSELEEVDEDDNLSATQGTQDNFNAGKTDRTNNNDSSFKTQAVTEAVAGAPEAGVSSGASAGQITALQASFTKQLDTMQAIISQHLDTRLQSINQVLEESGKTNTDRFSDLNSDLNSLKADVQLLQTNQKKQGSGNAGGKSPMVRQESSLSLIGGDRSPTNNANTSQLNAAIKRIDEQLQSLQLKFQADQQLKAQNNSVDIFALSKTLENSIKKLEAKNEEHLKRVVQTELKAASTMQEVQAIAQELKSKISKIGKDLLRTVNLKEEVRIRIDQFSQNVQSLSDQFQNSVSTQNDQIGQMKEILKGELRDLKSANQIFKFEIDRNQSLFRQLQSELITTIEEKKEQNESILNSMTDAAKKIQKDSKREGIKNRSQSVSQQPSIASLLPQLKTVTEQSVTKLTHRQLRVADLLKGQRGMPSGLFSPSMHLLADQSMLSLKGRFDQSDGIVSQKAFLTSPSPASLREEVNESKNLLSPQGIDQQKSQRKVFGAQDYLERQQKMKQLNLNGSDPTISALSAKNLEATTQNPSEDFAEFHVKLGSQIGSVKQLF